jgi:hypothetical protein
MSLHNLAKHVQRKGRGQDKMLVHMTPEEVHGLQRLAMAHGGSLTINPETGLPEAGFLMKILPIVAAAAATYFTAGAAAPALSSALAGEALAAGTVTAGGGALAGGLAGAGVGGISSAIKGGDVGKGALMGGLGGAIAGGMGAYGGAPDASAATSPLAESNKVAEITAGTNQGTQLSDLVKSGGSVPADQVGNLPYSGQGATNTLPEGYKINEFGDAYKQPPPEQNFLERMVSKPSVPTPPTNDDNKAQLEAAKLAKDFAGKGMFEKGLIYGAPGIGAALGDTKNTTLPGAVPYTSSMTLSPDFKGYEPERPNPYYKPQYTRYAADGGLMALAPGGIAEEKKKKQRASLTADRTMAAMNADQAGLANLNNARYGANMTGASPLSSMTLGDLPANAVAGARGGLADLGGYSDGGRLLKGPGDGMSDNIPAQIGRKQPARLADGEFVVPADVVSHLGNGSTDAGAKRLYSMMDKVRQARTGKKKQAPSVNTQRMMPA